MLFPKWKDIGQVFGEEESFEESFTKQQNYNNSQLMGFFAWKYNFHNAMKRPKEFAVYRSNL